jgi:hypothetical protein
MEKSFNISPAYRIGLLLLLTEEINSKIESADMNFFPRVSLNIH